MGARLKVCQPRSLEQGVSAVRSEREATVKGVYTGCCPNVFSLNSKPILIHLRLAPGDAKTGPSGSNAPGAGLIFRLAKLY